MLSETNKTVSRRFFEEVFGKGKLNVLDEIVAKDHINSGPGNPPGLAPGIEGTKQLVTMYRNAFPDIRFTVDEKIAESWPIFDQFGMMQQLGIIPTPELAAK